LASQGETITQTEQVVTSALAYKVWCSLPSVVSGGAGAAVDYGWYVSIFANGAGRIEVLDANGRQVAVVPAYRALSFRSRAGDEPWEVMENSSGTELATIADLAVTDLTPTASAASLPAAYGDAATQNAAVDTQIGVVVTDVESELAIAFAQIEVKVNAVIAALQSAGIIANVVQTEGTDTLALADVRTPQVVDDSERTVNSARAANTIAILPEVEASGTGAAVPPLHNVRFSATSSGRIEVLDFLHRRVCFVEPYTSRTVLALDVANQRWADLGEISPALNALVPAPQVAPLSVTLPTFAAPASNFAAAYTNDATYLASLEASADNAFGGLVTTLAAAYAEVETTINAILVAMEVATLHAAA
jgi:hypothetical protein